MTETLRQKDIDTLLGRTPAETTPPAAEVVPYNFARPPRLTRNRRTVLESILERYSASLQLALSSRLRTPVEVSLHSVEQATFSELMLSLGMPCACFTFPLGPGVAGAGVLDLGSELAFGLIERLFGGMVGAAPPARGLTPLEQKVVRGFAERAIALLGPAWEGTVPLAPGEATFHSNPDLVDVLDRDESVLVASLNIGIGTLRQLVTVALPLAALRGFLDEPQRSRAGASPGRAAARLTGVEQRMRGVTLVVAARLPRLWLTARQIAALAPGQVLETGHPQGDPIDVTVNGLMRYRASLGQVRRQVGVCITTTVTAPVDDRPGAVRKGRIS